MSVVDDYITLENSISTPTVSTNVIDVDKKFETVLEKLLDVVLVGQNHSICIEEIRGDIKHLVDEQVNSVNKVIRIVTSMVSIASFMCIIVLLLK